MGHLRPDASRTAQPDVHRTAEVHPTAIVDGRAVLGAGVVVGPYAIIGPGVRVGAGSRIGPHVLIERDTSLGEGCRIGQGAVLGTDPQDLKYEGERSELMVGDRTVVREYATLNRGTAASGRTVVGGDCLLMAYAHVAHDCRLGNHVVLSNAVNMAGHVTIDDWVVVGGLVGIHQHVRIGTHAFVGGGARVSQDIPPYCRAAGGRPRLYGINTVGLERRGFTAETRRHLRQAYRILFQSGLNVSQAMARVETDIEPIPEVRHLLDFIRDSERGISLG